MPAGAAQGSPLAGMPPTSCAGHCVASRLCAVGTLEDRADVAVAHCAKRLAAKLSAILPGPMGTVIDLPGGLIPACCAKDCGTRAAELAALKKTGWDIPWAAAIAGFGTTLGPVGICGAMIGAGLGLAR